MKTYTRITEINDGWFGGAPHFISVDGGRGKPVALCDMLPPEARPEGVSSPEGSFKITVEFTPRPRPVRLDAFIAMEPGAGDESLGTIWFVAPDGTKIRLGGTFEIVPPKKDGEA